MAALLLLISLPAAAAELRRGNGGEPDSLDPAQGGTQWEDNIVGDLMVGLTTLDAAARPIPGIAARWEVSRDGLTWTFHLRPAQWSDGTAVSAGDFVFAFRRLVAPATRSRYAANLWVLKNGAAISAGKLPPNDLGAAAPQTDRLVLTLEHPAPYLPELLAHITASPVPHGAKSGWARPGAYISDGPYLLKEWLPNDHITLTKNPRFYDAAHVVMDTVIYYPTTDSAAAVKRFRAGELDLQSPVAGTEIAWLKANLPASLKVTPSLALSYVAINLARLKDVRVRRALNLAIDREAITQKVLKLGEPAAYAIVQPGTANYPGDVAFDFRKAPFASRLAEAQVLMRQAGYGPANRLAISFAITNSPDNRRLAAVLQAMLSQIHVKLTIRAADVPNHFRSLRAHDYDLGIANWYADFNDASNFLELLRGHAGNNYAGYRNPAFDRLLDKAAAEPDAARRSALL
ncbi:MAG: peptide ABC transporter substrate-binding protein, partial [Alphaproteobacteria bacterium]|nr:peptide ABC transporter substrate-binding protein [Alphaproteobacteria bacterium]